MPVTADEHKRTLSAFWWVAAGATLALLPFESRLQLTEVAGVTVTPLHLVAPVAIGSWALLLVRDRRLPSVPRVLLAALGIALAGALVSAWLARDFNAESFRFIAISMVVWVAFVALVDMVRTERHAAWMSAVLVGAFAAAAVVGIVLLVLPVDVTVALLGQDHTVAGARRLQATLGYPNTAAAAFAACAFVAIGLLGTSRGRGARLLIGAALVVLIVATGLTLSRGAVLGLAAGFITLVVLAVVVNRRRMALAAAAAAAATLGVLVLAQLAAVPIERLWTDSEGDFYGATYEAPGSVILEPGGEPTAVSVVVTNTGSSGWHTGQYRLGYHWLDAEEDEIVAFGLLGSDLGEVPVGDSATATALVSPLDNRLRRLAWDVYQVGGEWFSERGVPVATSGTWGQPSGPLPSIGPQTLLLYPALLPEPSRSELWRAAAAMLRDAPLLGVGPGTFRLRYGEYLGWPEFDTRIHANSTYLELAATTGMVGLGTFLFVSAYALWRQAWHVLARPSPSGWLLSAGLVAAAVAFAAHGVVDYFLGFNGTLGLYCAILGIGLGLSLGRRDRTPASALGNSTPG